MRRSLSNSKACDLIDEDGAMEVVQGIIIKEAIEKTILGGRDINRINTRSDEAAAKAFYEIASGQVATLDIYVDGWLASISHLKARTINQMKRMLCPSSRKKQAIFPLERQ